MNCNFSLYDLGLSCKLKDLKLVGASQQINNALIYLSELDVEIWHKQDLELDGW